MENRKSPLWRAEVPAHVRRHLTAQPHSDLTPVEWFKAKNGGHMPKATPLYPSKN